jgi:RNA polymerase sigma-70 factor, ECF subfamily
MERDGSELPALLATDVRHTFRDVVERYQHSLYTFACRLSGSQQDAEDIVQEAFVRAYIALVAYPAARIQTLKLRPWLYRITLNEFHHHVRGARLHVVPMDLTDGSPVLDIEGAMDDQPDIHVECQEQLKELEAAVATLPERYRVPVVCAYFEQLSYQEIAELLDQPLGTVKSAVFRGVRHLRAMLGAQERDAGEGCTWSRKISNDK